MRKLIFNIQVIHRDVISLAFCMRKRKCFPLERTSLTENKCAGKVHCIRRHLVTIEIQQAFTFARYSRAINIRTLRSQMQLHLQFIIHIMVSLHALNRLKSNLNGINSVANLFWGVFQVVKSNLENTNNVNKTDDRRFATNRERLLPRAIRLIRPYGEIRRQYSYATHMETPHNYRKQLI